MVNAVTGRMIGRELCEALGLDIKGVRTIDIHVAAKEAVTVSVTRLVQDEQARAVNTVLEKYELHPATIQPILGEEEREKICREWEAAYTGPSPAGMAKGGA